MVVVICSSSLVAKSRQALTSMLRDFKAAFAKHGLTMNVDKCFVQSNRTYKNPPKPIVIEGQDMQWKSPAEGFKVLGTQFTLEGGTSAELEARLAAAWSKFYSLKSVLCRKTASISKRLRLLHNTVGPTLLWCAESWSVSKKERLQIKTLQNAMLRRIVPCSRAYEEPWVDWLRRHTHKARAHLDAARLPCWYELSWRRKWAWAGTLTQMPQQSWPRKLTFWRDVEWQHDEKGEASRPKHRQRGRPVRWEDDIWAYIDAKELGSWAELASTPMLWNAHANGFLDYHK